MIRNPTFPRSGILVGGWPARRKQLENCFLIGLPLGGSVLAIGHIASDGLGWIDATAFLLFYVLVGLGVALGRYCAEFDFRYNTRQISDTERTAAAVTGARGKRLTYRRIDRLAA